MKCMVENCGKKVHTRGVCRSCYQSAMRAVRAGRTTWEELAAFGMVLEKNAGRNDPFSVALRKRKKLAVRENAGH